MAKIEGEVGKRLLIKNVQHSYLQIGETFDYNIRNYVFQGRFTYFKHKNQNSIHSSRRYFQYSSKVCRVHNIGKHKKKLSVIPK